MNVVFEPLPTSPKKYAHEPLSFFFIYLLRQGKPCILVKQNFCECDGVARIRSIKLQRISLNAYTIKKLRYNFVKHIKNNLCVKIYKVMQR